MNGFLIGMAATLVAVGAMWVWIRAKRNKSATEIRVFSSIEKLRAIGQLSVYKVLTKDDIRTLWHIGIKNVVAFRLPVR